MTEHMLIRAADNIIAAGLVNHVGFTSWAIDARVIHVLVACNSFAAGIVTGGIIDAPVHHAKWAIHAHVILDELPRAAEYTVTIGVGT
jgi:C4-dicarboxylate transporter